jgi:hypothetical protein
MWKSYFLDRRTPPGALRRDMNIVREDGLFSAASYLCNASDNLRALGLLSLAAEIESFIAMLEAEILLLSVTDK